MIVIKNILVLPRVGSIYDQLFESKKDDNYKLGYFMGFFEEELKSGSVFHERIEERIKFENTLDEIISESEGKISDRKKFFDEADKSPEHYFHIDINVDIIKKGHTKYAFINDEIIHFEENLRLNE